MAKNTDPTPAPTDETLTELNARIADEATAASLARRPPASELAPVTTGDAPLA